MTDGTSKRGHLALSVLVLMQEPGEYMYARNVKAGLGLGFDRASDDELKERHTVKICRRCTAFEYMYGNEEENKDWIQGLRVSYEWVGMKGASPGRNLVGS